MTQYCLMITKVEEFEAEDDEEAKEIVAARCREISGLVLREHKIGWAFKVVDAGGTRH